METATAMAALVGAAVLLLAGPGKVAAPTALAQSVVTVSAYRVASGSARRVARAVGVTELAVALLVAANWVPVVSGGLLAGVGLGIVAFSVVAIGRRVTVSCGCFTAIPDRRQRPLGARNVIMGTALVALGLAYGLVGPQYSTGLGVRVVLALTLAAVLAARVSELKQLFLKGFGRGQ